MAILQALPQSRPATVFCARPEMLTGMPDHVERLKIPSLFERRGDETEGLDHVAHPETCHCAPLGWPAISEAMACITSWFARARPALMVVDVSAEIAQLARLCSIPHVHILQHGDRTDAGHQAAFDGAAGLLAPCSEALAQTEWEPWRDRIHFAGGLGLNGAPPDRAMARSRLGVSEDRELVLVISGAGGDGVPAAPLGIGARALPRSLWVTIGPVREQWHATEPSNLEHKGWVQNAGDWIAAADLVIASTGNTTVHQILAAGIPYLAVPEWRYFDEQGRKAHALQAAGLAHRLSSFPASVDAWRRAIAAVRASHDPAAQKANVHPNAAQRAAAWLDDLATEMTGRPASARAASNSIALVGE